MHGALSDDEKPRDKNNDNGDHAEKHRKVSLVLFRVQKPEKADRDREENNIHPGHDPVDDSLRIPDARAWRRCRRRRGTPAR